jgi:hypothetical protein
LFWQIIVHRKFATHPLRLINNTGEYYSYHCLSDSPPARLEVGNDSLLI